VRRAAVVVGAAAGLAATVARNAAAHDVAERAGRSAAWTSGSAVPWSFDPLVVAGLAVSGVLYGIGLVRLRRRRASTATVGTGSSLAFAAGWLALVVALVSPLHALGGVLFSAHMVQHEVLMLIAAPLLVVGRAGFVMRIATPAALRRPLARLARRRAVAALVGCAALPLVAWTVHTIVLWAWHVPVLFDATQASEVVHAAQHCSFLAVAVLFWWVVLEPSRAMPDLVARFGVVFTTAIHTALLGALLTIARAPWYEAYAATTAAYGFTPLEDQQLGGLVMWVPGGVVYVAGALVIAARLLRGANSASVEPRQVGDRAAQARPIGPRRIELMPGDAVAGAAESQRP
jgi:putative membrane protein